MITTLIIMVIHFSSLTITVRNIILIAFAGALQKMGPGVPLKGLRGGRVQFLGLQYRRASGF